MMKYVFVDESWEDYLFWKNTNKKTLKRINDLLKDISRNSFSGIGKPEPLTGNFQSWWSVRINQKDRMVFRITNDSIVILQCGNHYLDK